MELDRNVFSAIDNAITKNPKAGLNGEVARFRHQLDLLGRSGQELSKNTTPQQRTMVRHAVKRALNLRQPPNNGDVASALNNLYAEIELVGEDEDIRHRVQAFARYIASYKL